MPGLHLHLHASGSERGSIPEFMLLLSQLQESSPCTSTMDIRSCLFVGVQEHGVAFAA
jgi:hypothetical protein